MREMIELHCDKDEVEGGKRAYSWWCRFCCFCGGDFAPLLRHSAAFPPPLALRYSLAPLQTNPRFLGLLKEEEEEETPGTKNRRIHLFERRTDGTKTRRILVF
jgi:hypothetical protein